MKEKTDNMECFAKITSCKKKVYHKYYNNKFGIEKTNLFLQGVLCVILLLLCNVVSAQSDAFFYEDYDRLNRDVSEGFSFGDFDSNTFGLNFSEFITNETGLNFDGMNDDESGLSFGNFEYEDVALGNGLLLLGGMAVLRLRRKNIGSIKNSDN